MSLLGECADSQEMIPPQGGWHLTGAWGPLCCCLQGAGTPLCLGNLMLGPSTPQHTQAKPSQHHSSQPQEPRLGGSPSSLSHVVYGGPTVRPNCYRRWGWCEHGHQGPALRGLGPQGSSVSQVWEQGLQQGLTRRGAPLPPSGSQACARWPHVSTGGAGGVRGAPAMRPFTLSKMSWPSEVCVHD